MKGFVWNNYTRILVARDADSTCQLYLCVLVLRLSVIKLHAQELQQQLRFELFRAL